MTAKITTVTVTVLKCAHCGKLAVALRNTRITSHKCAGSWDIALEEKVPLTEVRAALPRVRKKG